MKLISRSTLLSGLSNVCYNLSAAWLAVIFIAPGVFSVAEEKYVSFLIANVPWSVLLFFLGLIFQELAKKYEHK